MRGTRLGVHPYDLKKHQKTIAPNKMSRTIEILDKKKNLKEFLFYFNTHRQNRDFSDFCDNSFTWACLKNNLKVAQLIYDNFKVSLNKEVCVLQCAFHHRAYDVIRWLISLADLDVNRIIERKSFLDDYNGSALYYAIKHTFPGDIIIALIERGAKSLSSEKIFVSQILCMYCLAIKGCEIDSESICLLHYFLYDRCENGDEDEVDLSHIYNMKADDDDFDFHSNTNITNAYNQTLFF